MTPTATRLARGALWLVPLAPALFQITLLAIAIAGRLRYPFDLEWMEGGLLHHALRVRAGEPLYPPPSSEFIPYLYTPLYPSLLAALGSVLTLGYALGRAVSVLALVGVAGVAARSLVRTPSGTTEDLAPRLVGLALALGLMSAAYPVVEGWYDLVRADTLLILLVTAPLAVAPAIARRARDAVGVRAHLGIAALAAALAAAYFCKQTAVFYVAAGGAIVLGTAPRKVPTFVAVAGLIGLGGTALAQWLTDGWFWVYVSEIHRAHDFSWDRFWRSFGNILWRPSLPGAAPYPALGAAMSLTVLAGLAATALAYRRTRAVPAGARPLLLWAPIFALSTLVGAIGWGTEFAHFNAYQPAFMHGALAAGAAVGAIAACARALGAIRASTVAPYLVALALGAALWQARWQPQRFVPTQADAAAGERLLERVRALPGEVWMPSHPYYLVLAGKRPWVHRMGIKDVTWRQSRQVLGLTEALASRRFSALVLDQRDVHLELPEVSRYYYRALELPANELPRVRSGARVAPESVWLPIPDGDPSGSAP